MLFKQSSTGVYRFYPFTQEKQELFLKPHRLNLCRPTFCMLHLNECMDHFRPHLYSSLHPTCKDVFWLTLPGNRFILSLLILTFNQTSLVQCQLNIVPLLSAPVVIFVVKNYISGNLDRWTRLGQQVFLLKRDSERRHITLHDFSINTNFKSMLPVWELRDQNVNINSIYSRFENAH